MTPGPYQAQYDSPQPYYLDVIKSADDGRPLANWLYVIRAKPLTPHHIGLWMAEFNGVNGGEDGALTFLAMVNRGARR